MNYQKILARVSGFAAAGAVALMSVAPTFALTGDLPTLEDLYSKNDWVDAIVAAVTQVGPYVLALFGIMLVVGVGMALLGKGKKQLVAAFK